MNTEEINLNKQLEDIKRSIQSLRLTKPRENPSRKDDLNFEMNDCNIDRYRDEVVFSKDINMQHIQISHDSKYIFIPYIQNGSFKFLKSNNRGSSFVEGTYRMGNDMINRLSSPVIIQSHYTRFGTYPFTILIYDEITFNFYIFSMALSASHLISQGPIGNGIIPLSYCISDEYYSENFQYATILCKVGQSLWVYKCLNFNTYSPEWSSYTEVTIIDEYSLITPIKFSYNGKVQVFFITNTSESAIDQNQYPTMFICNMSRYEQDFNNYLGGNPFRSSELTSDNNTYINNFRIIHDFTMDYYGYIANIFFKSNGTIFCGKINTYDKIVINYKSIDLSDDIGSLSSDTYCNTIIMILKDTNKLLLSQNGLNNYNIINDYVDCNYLINFKLMNNASSAMIIYRKENKNYIELVDLPKIKYPKVREINSSYLPKINSTNDGQLPTYYISELDDFLYIDSYEQMTLLLHVSILPNLMYKTLTIIKRVNGDDNLMIAMSNYNDTNGISFLAEGTYETTNKLILGNSRMLSKYSSDGNILIMSV